MSPDPRAWCAGVASRTRETQTWRPPAPAPQRTSTGALQYSAATNTQVLHTAHSAEPNSITRQADSPTAPSPTTSHPGRSAAQTRSITGARSADNATSRSETERGAAGQLTRGQRPSPTSSHGRGHAPPPLKGRSPRHSEIHTQRGKECRHENSRQSMLLHAASAASLCLRTLVGGALVCFVRAGVGIVRGLANIEHGVGAWRLSMRIWIGERLGPP